MCPSFCCMLITSTSSANRFVELINGVPIHPSNPWVAPGVALDRDVCPPSCPPQSTSLQLIYNTFTIAPIYNTSSSWTRVWRAFLMSLRHHSLDIYMSQSTMIHKQIHLLLRDPIHPHRSMVLHPHLGGIVFIIMQRPILKRTAYFLQ